MNKQSLGRKKLLAVSGGLAAIAAVLVACGGGGDSGPATPTTPVPTAPQGGPVSADLAMAKAYDTAGAAYSTGTDNPILKWSYRVWCQSGYRYVPATGTNGIDALADRTTDLVTPKGFISVAEASTPLPAGGVKFLDNAWAFGNDYAVTIVVRTPTGSLVMFDPPAKTADMQTHVLDQMTAAGLSVTNVSYVVIGHETGEYTGLKLLRTKATAAKVVAGNATAKAILTAGAGPVDFTVLAATEQDQGVLRVTVETGVDIVAIMAGTTSGAVQAIVPVAHKAGTEKLVVWSGADPAISSLQVYASGMNVVDNMVVREQGSALIHTSAFQGGIFGYLRKIKANGATAANPMLMGEEGVRRWVGIQTYCARALAQRISDKTWVAL